MGGRRLELLHIAAPDPKSGASTNFATRPSLRYLVFKFLLCGKLVSVVYQPLTKQYLIVLFGRVPARPFNCDKINLPQPKGHVKLIKAQKNKNKPLLLPHIGRDA